MEFRLGGQICILGVGEKVVKSEKSETNGTEGNIF